MKPVFANLILYRSILILSLVYLLGCTNSSLNPTKISEDSLTARLKENERLNISSRKSQFLLGSLKLALHQTMLNYLDKIAVNGSFAHLNKTGKVESLYVTKHHPEVFMHQDRNSYVLCVSAKNKTGETFPVDIYIKYRDNEQANLRESGRDLVVYETRIGNDNRSFLMGLMKNKVFNRI